jgi:hypothetical protein
MAKVRIGFSTAFELENELVGIGTDNPTNTLQALGNIHSTNAKAVGITTLTTPFEGFVDTKASISGLEGSEQGSLSGEIIIEGSVTVSAGATFRSGPENLTVTDSFTLPGISDDKPSVGTTRFNENLAALEFYTGVEWRAVNSYVDSGNRGRGIAGGGGEPGTSPYNYASNKIDYINIPSLGNAISFGTLTKDTRHVQAVSNEIRGIFYLGYSEPGAHNNELDYITIASQGNSMEFGERTTYGYSPGSCCSSTRGIWGGGTAPSGKINSINYVEIMTKGDTVDFGDLTVARASCMSTANSPTRGLFAGGSTPSDISGIDTITMASLGNAVEYGDLIRAAQNCTGASNSTRAFFVGGYTGGHTKEMQNIDISSGGNAVYFGDLQRAGSYHKCLASQTRGIITSGSPSIDTKIQYIEIASTGNASHFGDLSYNSYEAGTLSDCHGGLGGF